MVISLSGGSGASEMLLGYCSGDESLSRRPHSEELLQTSDAEMFGDERQLGAIDRRIVTEP